jgi:sRNA-binding carbon storage regulator CsrA
MKDDIVQEQFTGQLQEPRSELTLRDEIYEEIISNNHTFANSKQLSACSSKFQHT